MKHIAFTGNCILIDGRFDYIQMPMPYFYFPKTENSFGIL